MPYLRAKIDVGLLGLRVLKLGERSQDADMFQTGQLSQQIMLYSLSMRDIVGYNLHTILDMASTSRTNIEVFYPKPGSALGIPRLLSRVSHPSRCHLRSARNIRSTDESDRVEP